MLIRLKQDRARTIAPTDGSPPIEVEANGTAEVSDALGTSLLAQSDLWAPAGPTSVETSVPAVLAQVGNSKDRARTALAREQEQDKPRSSLVAALNKIIDTEES